MSIGPCGRRINSGPGRWAPTIPGPRLAPAVQHTAHQVHQELFGQVQQPLQTFAVVNGVPQSTDWRPGFGTYTVNPDCTGTAVLFPTPGAPPIPQHFVIVNNGKEILGVVDGNALAVISKRVE